MLVEELLPELNWIFEGVIDSIMHVVDFANVSNVHRLAADHLGVFF